VQIAESVFGPNAEKTGESLSDLGFLYSQTDRDPEASPLLERALKVQTGALGPQAIELANTMKELGDAYMIAARYQDAATTFLSESKVYAARVGMNWLEYVRTQLDLSNAQDELAMLTQEAACSKMWPPFSPGWKMLPRGDHRQSWNKLMLLLSTI
jgi:hypothetical protein